MCWNSRGFLCGYSDMTFVLHVVCWDRSLFRRDYIEVAEMLPFSMTVTVRGMF